MVERNITTRDQIGIGGHSYGAFMTANLLAHSDIFQAGIARSGAYNRSLTPFGFQSEQRTFWEAPEIYFEMSPFMHAHKVNEPILLIHVAMLTTTQVHFLCKEEILSCLERARCYGKAGYASPRESRV